MRLLPQLLVVVMLLAIGGGVWWRTGETRAFERATAETRSALLRIQQQVHLQSALAARDGASRRHPAGIDPAWFKGAPPANALLGPEHPWLEVDATAPASMRHPTVPFTHRTEDAAFWYNPAAGVVRARVPAGISDSRALALYNEVNDSDLAGIFVGGRPD